MCLQQNENGDTRRVPLRCLVPRQLRFLCADDGTFSRVGSRACRCSSNAPGAHERAQGPVAGPVMCAVQARPARSGRGGNHLLPGPRPPARVFAEPPGHRSRLAGNAFRCIRWRDATIVGALRQARMNAPSKSRQGPADASVSGIGKGAFVPGNATLSRRSGRGAGRSRRLLADLCGLCRGRPPEAFHGGAAQGRAGLRCECMSGDRSAAIRRAASGLPGAAERMPRQPFSARSACRCTSCQ